MALRLWGGPPGSAADPPVSLPRPTDDNEKPVSPPSWNESVTRFFNGAATHLSKYREFLPPATTPQDDQPLIGSRFDLQVGKPCLCRWRICSPETL